MTPEQRIHAIVFNAVDRALSDNGHWVRLGVRDAIAKAAIAALAEQGQVIVSADDYRYVLDRAEQFAMHRFDADDSVLVARLRAALPERTEDV